MSGRGDETANNSDLLYLKYIYQALINLVDAFASGYIGVPDGNLNRAYIIVCHSVKELSESDAIKWPPEPEWRPYNNLLGLSSDDILKWDEILRPRCLEILTSVEEEALAFGIVDYGPPADARDYLDAIYNLLSAYQGKKEIEEERWLKAMQELAETHATIESSRRPLPTSASATTAKGRDKFLIFESDQTIEYKSETYSLPDKQYQAVLYMVECHQTGQRSIRKNTIYESCGAPDHASEVSPKRWFKDKGGPAERFVKDGLLENVEYDRWRIPVDPALFEIIPAPAISETEEDDA